MESNRLLARHAPLGHNGPVPETPLSPSEIADLADEVRGLLHLMDSGEMPASPTARARVEGAALALDVVQGKLASLLEALGL